jgi:non-ribosomal peptide synthetase component F
VRERELFGAPLAELQMVQGHVADMALGIDAAALLVYRAAWTKDMGAARVTREAAMAKLHATETAQEVIDKAVQLHGGDGVRSGHPVESLYREIRALRIYEGASDVQKDTFTRDNLPPPTSGPTCCWTRFDYPEWLNAAVELTDRMVERGFGDHVALIGNGRQRTYKELTDWTNRIAHALVEDYGVKPGNRVLIRSANNPAMVACWLAATKAGAVVVNTMPMLRAGELDAIVDKAEISHALCDTRLMEELVLRQGQRPPEDRWWASTAPPTTTPSLTGRAVKAGALQAVRPGATMWRCWASPRAPRASPRPRCISTATF